MIVSFDLKVSDEGKEERLYWIGVLWKLIDEFDPSRPYLTDKDFHIWLHDTWKIKMITAADNPDALAGVSIDDTTVSMLLLKYPRRKLTE